MFRVSILNLEHTMTKTLLASLLLAFSGSHAYAGSSGSNPLILDAHRVILCGDNSVINDKNCPSTFKDPDGVEIWTQPTWGAAVAMEVNELSREQRETHLDRLSGALEDIEDLAEWFESDERMLRALSKELPGLEFKRGVIGLPEGERYAVTIAMHRVSPDQVPMSLLSDALALDLLSVADDAGWVVIDSNGYINNTELWDIHAGRTIDAGDLGYINTDELWK